MADLNPFSKVLQKHAGRAKERLLQNFGKADRTTDEDFDFHVKNFSKQQNAALRLQKEFKNYHQCLKAMQAARRSLVETVNELYEPCWVGLDQFLIKTEVLNKNYDEFCDKINDELLSPVATHVSQFPDCTNKISKRNRKLLDYDNCRHNLQNLETMKRREESKISKAKEQLEDARNLFEVINTELHSELPAIYDSRVSFFVSHLRCLFITEAQFHNKDSTLLEEISGILESLEETYKKNPLPSFNEKSKNSDELEAKESHSSEKNYKEEDASSSSGSFVFSTPPTTADRNLNLEMLSEMSTVEELTEKEKIVPLKPKPQLVTFYKQEDSTDNALYMGENNVPFKSNSGTKQLVILNKIEDSPSSCRTYSLDSSVDGATALACSAFVDASSPDNVLYADDKVFPPKVNQETEQLASLDKMEDSPSSCRTYTIESAVDSATSLTTSDSNPSATSLTTSDSNPDSDFYGKENIVLLEPKPLSVSLDKMEDSPSSCRTYTIKSAVESATSLTTSDSNPSATSLTTSDSNPDSDFYGKENIVLLEPKPLSVSLDKMEDSPSSCRTYTIKSAVESATSLTTSDSNPSATSLTTSDSNPDSDFYGKENIVPFEPKPLLVTLSKKEDSPSWCRTCTIDSAVDSATSLTSSDSNPDSDFYVNENIEPRPMLVTLYKREDSPETAGGNTVAKRSPRKFKFLNRNRFIDLFKMQDSPSSRLSMDSPVDSSTALASITSILSSSPDNVISGGDKSFPSKVSRETEQLESLEKMEDSPSSCRTYTIESAVDSATSLTTSDSYPDSATSLTTSDSNPESDFFGTEKIVPLEPKPLLVSHDKVEDSPSSCHTYSIESAVDSTTSLTTSASSSDNVFGGKNTVPTKRNAGELHLMTLNKMLDSANAFACSGSVEASSPDKVLDGGKNTVPTKRNTGELQLMTLNKMLDSANAFACSDSVEASSPDKALDGEEKSSPKPEYKLRSIYNAGVDSPSLLDYPCSVDSTTSLDFPASVDTSCPDNVPYGDEKSDPVPENKLKTIYKIALDSPTSDNVLYRVKGTYKYTAEDVDELSFNVGDVIDVVAYDDPEEQEDGWLMGIFNGKKGLFPANFTSRI